MASIRIYLGDWLKNAAIIGLIKVLSRKETNENRIKSKNDYIEFDSSLLENFEETYFEVLIEKNENTLPWHKLVSCESELDNILENTFTKKSIERVNSIIEDFKSKLTSNSYKNGYLILDNSTDLIELEKKLKKIKLTKKEEVEDVKDDIINQITIIKDIIKYLRKPEVKRVLAAKNVMYNVIQNFWNNISFFYKDNNKGDMYELYKKDFIEPALNYIEKDNKKNKYTCFTCDNKISKLNKPEAYDLTWIVKIGVDGSRKSSHFWNMQNDAYICPICNILYSCLPLGFKTIRNKGIFINNNKNIKTLKTSNITKEIIKEENFHEIEQMSYLNVANSMEQSNIENLDKEFENIQVIKIDGDNATRPYSFNVLSRSLLYLVYKNRKTLNNLIKITVRITDKYSLNLYDEVISRLYDGKNLFDLISKLLTMYLDEKFYGLYYIYKILEINNSIIGGAKMNYKETGKFKNYGMKLRKAYIQKNATSKLPGITYRLLNALKTKDSGKFLDTLINAYMYMKIEIPTEFVKVLNNQDVLQEVGYAFLIGLQGLDEENKEDIKNKEKVKNEGEEK